MSNHRELHIIPGSSAAGIVKQGLCLSWDDLLVHDDLLSCGRLFSLRSVDEWKSLRAEYLSSLYPFEWSFASEHHDLLSCSDDLRSAERATVWVGTGLADQLFLAWIIQFFRLTNIDLQILRVIQFVLDAGGRYEILGIGMLNEAQVRSHPEPFALDAAAIESLDRAWYAVTAPTPVQLLEFLAASDAPLPLLKRSIQWLITRFPDFESGLSLWDLELLRQVAEKGPKAEKVIGFAIIRLIDSLDSVGDAYLLSRLRRLGDSSLRKPLVSLSGNPIELRQTQVILTDAGKAVLDGTMNSVLLNGIDDWVAGIHLDSNEGNVWFQRDALLVDSPSSIR